MPLLKPILETQLRSLFTDLSTNQDSADAMNQLVSKLATIIDKSVNKLLNWVSNMGLSNGIRLKINYQ